MSAVKELTKDLNTKRNVMTEEEIVQNVLDLMVHKRIEGVDKNEFGDDVETNANEVLHSTQTGYGQELIPDEVLSQIVFDLVPQYSRLLPYLPSFHGSNMNLVEKVPVIGEVDFFQGNDEWTTGAPTEDQARLKNPTGEATITQASFIADVALSKRLLNYSIVDIENWIKRRLAESAARTIDAYIINADAETGGTGNVNSDDQAPATTFTASGGANHYSLQGDHGLRELMINGSGLSHNAGTLAWDDFLSILTLIGDYAADPAQLLWIMDRSTYNKALSLTEFKDASLNGKNSVIFNQSITNILGSDVHINRDMPLTEADGKVSATPANNTKGQILLLKRDAVQYGYGQSMETDMRKVIGKGVQLFATFEFGFTVANQLAGQADSVLAGGINITV